MLASIPFPDISPVLFALNIPLWQFTFSGHDFSIGGFELAIRWYALAYITGIIFAGWVMRLAIRRPNLWPNSKVALNEKNLDDLITWLIIGIILGGRLGYVLFYQPFYYLSDPIAALRIFDGGMSFHGGFLGVLVAGILFCRKYQIYSLCAADVMAVSAPAGLLFGRMANFINAELWGRETSMPWGVMFPGYNAQTCTDAATGLCARHPSQLYEALGEGLILGLVLLYLLFKTSALRRTGLLTGIFVFGYGLTRFLVELVRQPDTHFQSLENPVGYIIQMGSWGLTMGQVLSLPMLMIGLWFIAKARKA
ncbi:MAG: prolipoprotein diacylglyceryl transferase [Planktomarina sp.]|nr:prolipoprotein diacylglyceryl transferase [Planktomarina sp.]